MARSPLSPPSPPSAAAAVVAAVRDTGQRDQLHVAYANLRPSPLPAAVAPGRDCLWTLVAAAAVAATPVQS